MGVNILSPLDNSGKGLIATTYHDDYITKGRKYSIESVATIPAETAVNFLLNLSAVESDYGIYVLPIEVSSESENIVIRIYEETDYSAGTVIPLRNVNRTKSDTTKSIVTSGATGSDKGLLFRTHEVFASSQGNVTNSGSGGGSAIILDTNKNYLVELENTGNGSTKIDYSFSIFE